MVTSAEFPIYVDRSEWKIVSVSSENKGEEARQAIDGNPSTIWHSRWSENEAKHPHEIVVDMASLLEIDQFIYQPRDSDVSRRTNSTSARTDRHGRVRLPASLSIPLLPRL